MLKRNLFLFLIVILAIIPRFIFLDRIPSAANNDELHYAINSQSFLMSGKDTSGSVTPIDLLLFKYPKDDIQAELPYFIDAPFLGLFGSNLFNLVFPYAFLSFLSIPLLYLITKKLFDEKTAVVAGLLGAINPWLIFVGRTSYEAGSAIFFFLAVFYSLLIAKGWKILLVFPLALLAFYSYIGTKLIFLPFILITIVYVYFLNNRKYLKQYIVFFILCLLLTFFFLLRGTGRTSELVTPNSPQIVQKVQEQRKTTIRNPVMNLYENKFFVYSEVLTKNLFNVFSPYYLFAGGDYFYILGIHGVLYYIDVLFLGLGIAFLFFVKRKLFVFLGLLVVISSLPEVFHNPYGSGVFSAHVTLMVPFLIMIAAFGIAHNLGKVKNKKHFYLVTGLVALIYLLLFLNFSNSYFFRFPLQNGTFSMQNRILSRYITFNNGPVVIYSTNKLKAFEEYIFYTNSYKDKKKEIDQAFESKNYMLGNVSFNECGQRPAIPQKNLIIDDANCGRKLPDAISIAQLFDNGAAYYIYNDNVCRKYNLPHFISNVKLANLSVEKLTEKDFCEDFIVSY